MVDFGAIRNDFPMLQKTVDGQPLIYFDTAATAQKPQCVIDAVTDFYTHHYGTVHRAIYSLAAHATESYQAVRERVVGFINAPSEREVIFTRGTTESINLVAYSFGRAFVKEGDEIVVSTIEHHANIVPWQILCEERGATLRVIPVDDRGVLDMEAYRALLNDRTRLVAVVHIANAIGTVNPIKEMARLAHDAGAVIVVDGAQAAPHMPLDMQDLDCDFYAFSGHKAYGPTGIGILYGKERFLEAMPPYQCGGDMIDQVTLEKTTYADLPLKFEAGTPSIAQVIGLGAAIDYLEQIGREEIVGHETELLAHATRRFQEIEGLRIVGTAPEKGAIVSFVVEGIHPLDLGTMLDLKGICVRTGHHCAQPTLCRFGMSAAVRASFGFYNTLEEIDRFVEALKGVCSQLRV